MKTASTVMNRGGHNEYNSTHGRKKTYQTVRKTVPKENTRQHIRSLQVGTVNCILYIGRFYQTIISIQASSILQGTHNYNGDLKICRTDDYQSKWSLTKGA